MYCKILIVFGLAFPMSEVIADSIPGSYFQFFYVYLFMGSLAFLLYIYVELLRVRTNVAMRRRSKKRGLKGFLERLRRMATRSVQRVSKPIMSQHFLQSLFPRSDNAVLLLQEMLFTTSV